MTGQAKSRSNGTSIDRSRVKILLCDRNPESCEEVSTLLTTCCYQGMYVFRSIQSFLSAFNCCSIRKYYGLKRSYTLLY